MSTSITTRQTAGTGATVKGAPLTNAEVDANFINLNAAAQPAGGTGGQVLAKVDGADFNSQWIDNYATALKFAAKNTTAGTLTKGTVVYVSGGAGANPYIAPADASAEGTSATTVGIIEADVAVNGFVNVVRYGALTGVDTAAAADGDPVWLSGSVAGGMVFGLANKPVAPNHLVYLGTVTRAHAVNGEIQVSVSNGWELSELHDVAITSAAGGDFLVRDGATSLWKNAAPAAARATLSISNVEDKSSATIRGELTSSNVTTALGYTPLSNATSYLPLTGGTLTGLLTSSIGGAYGRIDGVDQYHAVILRGSVSGSTSQTITAANVMEFIEHGGSWNFRQVDSLGTNKIWATVNTSGITWDGNQVLHAGNYGTYTRNPGGFAAASTGTGTSAHWYKVFTWQFSSIYTNIGLRFNVVTRGNQDQSLYELALSAEWDGSNSFYGVTLNTQSANALPDGHAWKLVGDPTTGVLSLYINRSASDWDEIVLFKNSQFYTGVTETYYNSDFGTTAPTGAASYNGTHRIILHSGNYTSYALPLSGGTLTGNLTVSANIDFTGAGSVLPGHFYTHDHDGTNVYFHVGQSGSTTNKVLNLRVFRDNGDVGLHRFTPDAYSINDQPVLHAGNFSSYALSLSGGTITSSTPAAGGGFLTINRSASTNQAYISFIGDALYIGVPSSSTNGDIGSVGTLSFSAGGYGKQATLATNGTFDSTNLTSGGNQVLHAGNFSSYAYPQANTPGGYVTPAGGLNGAVNGWSALDGYGTFVPNYGGSDWWVGVWTGGNSGRGIQIAGGYSDSELYFRKGAGGWSSWRRVLNDSNYSSYALPLSGGTVTGNTTIGRDLYISGQTGGNFGNRLIVGATTTSYTSQDTNLRPTIQAHGQYPVLSLNHTVTSNTNHGPTVQFTCNGVGNQFVVGTNGQGSQFFMGYSAATDWNPHNGIAGYNGTSFFEATTDGYIGIGAPGNWGGAGGGHPAYHLHGKGFNVGSHAGVFQNLTNGGVLGANGGGWLFQNDYGNHSWGITAEFRVSGASDRPSILFSSGQTSTTWSVGFGGYDDQFRINQNHGHRNGDWGTERFRIDTGGTPYFNGNVALHAGNYTSYSPSLTGSGASGTWGINITGSAGSAGWSTYSQILDTRAGQYSPDAYEDYRTTFEFTNQIVGGDWHTAMTMQGWHNGYAAWQIIGPASTSAHENWYLRSGVNTSWNSARAILHSGNFSSYALPLSGGTVTGSTLFYRNNPDINNGSYGVGNNHIELRTDNSSNPAIGFHRSGYTAVTLYHNANNSLRLRDANTGADSLMLHSGNYNSFALGILGDTFSISNWNDLTAFGSRRTAPDGADTNGPPINQYGNLLTFGHGDGVTQMQAGHDGRLAWRTKWNASDWTGWQTALDSGNYSGYALPLSGGTLSGAITVNGGSNSIIAQDNGGSGDWRGRIISRNSTYDRAAFLGVANGNTGVFAHNHALNAWAPLYVNTSDIGSFGGAVVFSRLQMDADGTDTWYRAQSGNRHRFTTTGGADFIIGNFSGVATLNGNQVLHAGNYTSYSPSLTGSGASGTWSINISGNAAEATRASGQGGYPHAGYGMYAFYNWGGNNGGASAPSESSYTVGLSVGSHPSDQAYGFQIARNMWNTGLWTRGYDSGWGSWVRLLDSSNYSSYALPLSGGTVSGYTTFDGGLSAGTGGGQRLYVYRSGTVRQGFGVDITGNSYESDWFGSAGPSNQGRLSLGFVSHSDGTTFSEIFRVNAGGGVNVLSGDLNINSSDGNIVFANSGTTKRGIIGTMGDNDQWFIGGGATASNVGYLEIATGDDGQGAGSAEPIYVSQYGPGNPVSGTLFRRATLLDASGNTSFPGALSTAGSITATAFYYSSDERKKKNIAKIESALSKLRKIGGVEFDWLDSGAHDAGVIAQRVKEHFSPGVGGTEDDLKVNTQAMIGLLFAAVAELSDIVLGDGL